MGATEMSTLMAGLVAEARSSRDHAINTIDAVERESRRDNARLAGQVDHYMRVHETSLADLLRREVPRLQEELETRSAPAAARDARFDPEDEWEVPGPAGRDEAPAPEPRRFADGGDDDEYPATWLR
jgi:hypothetical protein